jgi:hypothetical protein
MRVVFAFILYVASSVIAGASPQDSLQRIPDHKVLEVSFTQNRHLGSIPVPLISTGTLKLWPKKGLIWSTKKPFPSTLVISNKGLYQIEKNQLKPLERAAQNNMVFKTLSAILAGDFMNGPEGFDTTLISQNKILWHVKLTPQNEQVKSLISAIDIQGNTQVSKVIIQRTNGDYDEIIFADHKIKTLQKALSSQERGWLND